MLSRSRSELGSDLQRRRAGLDRDGSQPTTRPSTACGPRSAGRGPRQRSRPPSRSWPRRGRPTSPVSCSSSTEATPCSRPGDGTGHGRTTSHEHSSLAASLDQLSRTVRHLARSTCSPLARFQGVDVLRPDHAPVRAVRHGHGRIPAQHRARPSAYTGVVLLVVASCRPLGAPSSRSRPGRRPARPATSLPAHDLGRSCTPWCSRRSTTRCRGGPGRTSRRCPRPVTTRNARSRTTTVVTPWTRLVRCVTRDHHPRRHLRRRSRGRRTTWCPAPGAGTGCRSSW